MSGSKASQNIKSEQHIKGRGTTQKINPRFLHDQREVVITDQSSPDSFKTTVQTENPKNIISTNNSPDIPFTASINPYRGCEHGCIYCYARPTHAYLDLSPGIDFETRLIAKPRAAILLRKEISKKNYQCTPIALGTNTDPYQPIERDWKITRSIIEVFNEFDHPFSIVTKSWMIERDIDLLAGMALKNLVRVFISITTLNNKIARIMEPRATAPQRRLETIKRLSDAGIETGVLFAPVIPVLNDSEMESVLRSASEMGANYAGYVLLRLPHEVKPLFIDWLKKHLPDKAEHILSLVKQTRGGKLNESGFHERFRGKGHYAGMIAQRFKRISRKLHYLDEGTPLNTDLNLMNKHYEKQISLF